MAKEHQSHEAQNLSYHQMKAQAATAISLVSAYDRLYDKFFADLRKSQPEKVYSGLKVNFAHNKLALILEIQSKCKIKP